MNHPSLPDGKYLIAGTNGVIHFREIPGVENLQAPQAKLMSVVIKGILDRRLPWGLILFGLLLAVTMELCGVHSLPSSVGLYLPLSSTLPIFVGGVVRKFSDRIYQRKEDDASETEGTLFSSGLIAGGALVGILIPGLVGAGLSEHFAFGEHWFPALSQNRMFGMGVFAFLSIWLARVARLNKAKGERTDEFQSRTEDF